MKKNIQELIIPVLQEAIASLYKGVPCEEFYLDFPTDSRFGDLSTNIALRLSKSLKKPPIEIAKAIIQESGGKLRSILAGYIADIKVEGAGFINIYLTPQYFYEQLAEILAIGKDALKVDEGKGRKVLVEFVSANPTGALSVAHARQAAVGDSLANILQFLGFSVSREYYLNDEGNQINILGSSVELRMKELAGETVEFPENYYQGDYIYDIAKEVTKSVRKPPRRGQGQCASLPEGDKVTSVGDYAAEYILNIIKKELEDFGVSFDCWYSQKSLRESGKIDEAFGLLKKNGFLYEQDGALWFKSTAFGDDKDRVVIKSDGSYTYLAPDIAYHQDKYRRGYQWLVNLWGPDHHGYINRLKASVEACGHRPDSLSIVIVQLATIFRNGTPVQMSTRRGQYITLREVLDEVGRDASRFFFLMRRTSSHLDFDLEVAKKQTAENPVYYVQYAHARICSIVRNSGVEGIAAADFSLLKEKEELALIKKICQLPAVLHACLSTVDPYMITVYLQEVAESFHKFYDLHRVLSDDPSLTKSRLALIEAVRIVIAVGLDLAGVSKPEKM